MAKRPKYSRWRRLPGVYRFGDQKAPDPNQELQRLSLYVPGEALDEAQAQATRLGFETAQDYCTDLLLKALETERVRAQMVQVETRRGPLTGFHAIEDDPEYLADLHDAAVPRAVRMPPPLGTGLTWVEEDETPAEPAGPVVVPPVAPAPGVAARVVLRHAAQAETDADAFLPSLRKGLPVRQDEVAGLAQALFDLERELGADPTIDRRLAFALHRLAFESQVLHTDAWPDSFDSWTVDVLRAVQEAVERVLSGQDIRYYPETARADAEPPLRPELPR